MADDARYAEMELARLRETVDRYRDANGRLEREVRELRRELRSANRQIHLRQEMLNARRARTPESRRVIDAWRAHASDDGLTVALRDMQARIQVIAKAMSSGSRPIRHVTGESQ